MSKTVSFPLEGFNVGGGVRIIIQIANGLAAEGHSVKIIVPDYAARATFKLDDRVAVEVVGTRGPLNFRKLYYLLNMCWSSARGDVAFATGFKTAYYLWISRILRRSRTKLVYLIQHYDPAIFAFQGWPIRSRLAALTYRLPLKKIAVSDWIRDQIQAKA